MISPDMLLNVDYEDIVSNFEETCSRIFNFVGLKQPENPENFWKTSRVIDTNSASQARRPLFKGGVGQWKAFEDVKCADVEGCTGAAPNATYLGELQQALSQFY